ncbi:hypothetical protein ABPG72_005286 [Tetrahymena utriculariae]
MNQKIEIFLAKGRSIEFNLDDADNITVFFLDKRTSTKSEINFTKKQQIVRIFRSGRSRKNLFKKYLRENYYAFRIQQFQQNVYLRGGGSGNTKINTQKINEKLQILSKNELDYVQQNDNDNLIADYQDVLQFQQMELQQGTQQLQAEIFRMKQLKKEQKQGELIHQEKKVKKLQQSNVRKYQLKIEKILFSDIYIKLLTGDRLNFIGNKFYFIDLFEKYLDCLLRLSDYEIYSNKKDIYKQIEKLKKFERICIDLSIKYPVQDILFYISLMIKIQEINLEIYYEKYDGLTEAVSLTSNLLKLGYYGFKINIAEAALELVSIINFVFKKLDAFSSQGIFNALLYIEIFKIQNFTKAQNIQECENIYGQHLSKCFGQCYQGFESQEILFYISLIVNQEWNLKYIKDHNELTLMYVLNKIDYLLTLNFLQNHQKLFLIQFQQNCQNEQFKLSNKLVIKFIEYICDLFDTEFNEIKMKISDSEIFKLRIVYVITSIMVKFFKIFSAKKIDDMMEIVYIEDYSNILLHNLWQHICYIFITTRRLELQTIFEFAGNNFCCFMSNYLEKQKNIEKLQQKFNVSFIEFEQKCVEKLINLWDKFVSERKVEGLELKDDLLHDVQDMYINQRFKYLKGNNIFMKEQGEEEQLEISTPNNEMKITTMDKIKNFFKSNKLQDQSATTTIKLIKDNFLKQSECVVLVILAEGGSGKSMLLKKIQIDLTSDSSQLYFPIFIKCNQLNQKYPTIEAVLSSDEYSISNFDIIAIKKSSKRQKVILLDGYDEYTGENFNIYSDLNLSEWNNTKVILTSRKEKLDEHSIVQFVQVKEKNTNPEASFCILDLLPFNDDDIQTYCQNYIEKYRLSLMPTPNKDTNKHFFNKTKKIQKDQVNDQSTKEQEDHLANVKEALFIILDQGNTYNIVKLPINLYLLTRVIHEIDQDQINQIKYFDQLSLYQLFLKQYFKREAQNMVEILMNTNNYLKTELISIQNLILDQYFDYFQSVAMKMFLQKGQVTQFLVINQKDIPVVISEELQNSLKEEEDQQILVQRIKSFINNQIMNTPINQGNRIGKPNSQAYINQQLEFKHKSIYEYFVARAMINDFINYEKKGIRLSSLSEEELQKFNINQRLIMINIQNQSEPEILIKLSHILNSIISENINKYTYKHQRQSIGFYLEYIFMTRFYSCLNIGSSNLLSALFQNNFSFDNLDLSDCKFPYAYLFQSNKSTVNFRNCNLKYALILDSLIDTQNAKIRKTIGNIIDSQYYKFNHMEVEEFEFSMDCRYFAFYNQYQLQIWKYTKKFRLVQSFEGNYYLKKQKYKIQSGFTQCNKYYITKKGDIWSIKEKKFILLNTQDDDYSTKDMQKKSRIYADNISILSFGNPYLLTINSKGYKINIWDIRQKFQIYKVQEWPQQFVSAVFSSQCNFVAITQKDNSTYLLDAKNFIQINEFLRSKFVQFSFNEKFFILLQKNYKNDERYISLFDIQGNLIKRFVVTYLFRWYPKFSYDSKFLQLKIFNRWGQKHQDQFLDIQNDFKCVGSYDNIKSIEFFQDNKIIIKKGDLYIVDNLKSNIPLLVQNKVSNILKAIFSNQLKYFVTLSNNSYQIYEITYGFKYIKEVEVKEQILEQALFSQDDKYFATSLQTKDQTNICKVWDVGKYFQCKARIPCNQIIDIKFNSNLQQLIICEQAAINIYSILSNFKLYYALDMNALQIEICMKNNYLVTLHEQEIKCWDLNDRFKNVIKKQISPKTRSFKISQDFKFLFTIEQESYLNQDKYKIQVFDFSNNMSMIESIQENSMFLFTFDARMNRLMYEKDYYMCVWEMIDNKLEHIITYPDSNYSNLNDKDLEDGLTIVQQYYFSQDTKYLCEVNINKIKILNFNLDFHITNLSVIANRITSLAFSKDCKYLMTCTSEYKYSIWNLQKNFKLLTEIKLESIETEVQFSQNNKYLALYGKQKCIILDLNNRFQKLKEIQFDGDSIITALFSHQDHYLITGTQNGQLNIFDITKDFESIYQQQFYKQVKSITVQSQNNLFAAATSSGLVGVYSFETKILMRVLISEDNLGQIAISPSGQYLVAVCAKNIYLWDLFKNFDKIELEFQCKPKIATFTDKYLILVVLDKGLVILDPYQNFKQVSECKVHEKEITCIDITKDYKYLALGFKTSMCKVWDFQKYIERDNILYQI